MADPDPQGWVGGVVLAITTVCGGVAGWLKLRADERHVKRLQARADAAEKRADALFDELQQLGELQTADARTIQRLRSDLGHMTTDNASLRRSLRRMAEGLPPELRDAWKQALETDFAPLPSPREP